MFLHNPKVLKYFLFFNYYSKNFIKKTIKTLKKQLKHYKFILKMTYFQNKILRK